MFIVPSRANLDSIIGPIQIRVSEQSPYGLAYLNLHVKNETSAKVKFNLEFKYPSQQIAFDEILHLFKLSIYKDSEIYDCAVFTDFIDPLNPGDTLIYETYLATPSTDNTSTYKVKCRLWGNYE